MSLKKILEKRERFDVKTYLPGYGTIHIPLNCLLFSELLSLYFS